VKLQHTENQIKEQNQNLIKNENENDEVRFKIINIDEKINQIDPQKIEKKKKEKLDLILESDELLKSVNLNITIPNELSKIIENKPNNLEEFNLIINNVIAK
jgi:hypothetical protein